MSAILRIGSEDHRSSEPAAPDVSLLPAKLEGLANEGDQLTPLHAFTVDVEDYFQVSAFDKHVSRTDWSSYECRIEANVDLILEKLNRHGVKGTFFTLGWIAEQYPEMTRRIHDEGHEMASHGWWHYLADTQDLKTFKADVGAAKATLEDLCGCEIIGYRAPSFSINGSNLWTHEVLHELGYRYSSSIAPIEHDIYGWPEASRYPFPVAEGRLLEIPISTSSFAGRNIPCGGGGWFRLYPYMISRQFIERIAKSRNRYVFYCHPWEFDPEQPRMPGIDLKTRFRHYLNLKRMGHRVDQLLEDFNWGRMDQAFEVEIASLDVSASDALARAELPSIASSF